MSDYVDEFPIPQNFNIKDYQYKSKNDVPN